MKALFAAIILGWTPLSISAEECKIKGEARLWAYDYCFSVFETDDSIHPGVIKCADEAFKKITDIGECAAKKEFKLLICEIVGYHGKTLEDCLNSENIEGPSVRDGGI